MNIQAEVSLYPLQTQEIGKAIHGFVGDLECAGLTVRKGSMSTAVSGDVDAVFAAVGKAFRTVANGSQVVLVLKMSNACPSDGATKGKNTDVG